MICNNVTPASTVALLDSNGYYTSDNIESAMSEIFSRHEKNYMINGNFDIWQRGTSFTNPTSGQYTADGNQVWFDVSGGTFPTIIHSKQQFPSGFMKNSFYYYHISIRGGNSGCGNSAYYMHILRRVENGTRLLCGLGKKIAISFYIRNAIPLTLETTQNYGSGGSPSSTEFLAPLQIPVNNDFTKIVHIITTNTIAGKTFGTNNDDCVTFGLWLCAGSDYQSRALSTLSLSLGSVDIAQVQVNAGDTALDYVAPTFEDELRKCMRYYEKSCNSDVYPQTSYGSYNATGCYGIAIASTAIVSLASCFKVEKRITPAIVISGGEGATAGINYVRDNMVGGAKYMGSAPYVYWTTKTNLGCFINQGGTGANALTPGYYYSFYWTADAEF
jgi:hypothetical protein